MKRIPLTQGYVALVDDADFEAVRVFKWCLLKKGRRLYARRSIRKADGSRTISYLHRFLMGSDGECIDHLNGDGLDNQRHNLRPATAQQNVRAFCRKKPGTSSKYRGVFWFKNDMVWGACIKVNGLKKHLGCFALEKDAAFAYDAAARKYFGEFASPNFI